MLIKKFNSFALCIGILISSVCHNVSGAQNNLENKSSYNVEAEKSNGKEISGKIVDLGKKIKNKLKVVNDSISKEVYIPFSTAFGAGLTYKILTDGINYYYFNEENKTPRDAVEPEDKKEIERETSNSSEIIQKEENESNDFSQTDEKSKAKSNNSIVTPNSQNTESSSSVEEATDKITEDNSENSTKDPVPKTTGNVPDFSENLDTNQGVTGENSSNDPGNLTTKTNGEEQTHSSNDANTEVQNEELKQDIFPLFLADYSDPLVYLLVSLTPKKWGLQKAWHNLLHFRTKDSQVVTILKLILLILLYCNTAINIVDFVTNIYEILHKYFAKTVSDLNLKSWLVQQLVRFSPIADRLNGFMYICSLNRIEGTGLDFWLIHKFNNSVAFIIKCSLINIFLGKAGLNNYVYYKYITEPSEENSLTHINDNSEPEEICE